MSSSKKINITRRSFLGRAVLSSGVVLAPNILTGCATNGSFSAHSVPRKSPNERVTMAVIGVGNQGMNDLRGFISDERVQIVAVCDVCNYDATGYWAGKPGGRDYGQNEVNEYYASNTRSGNYKGCDAYNDFREVMQRDDIDTVLIAVPDHWHAIPVVAAARAGKDIYAEKPLSLTISDGRIMSDAVRDNNRIFQTGSQQRSDARFRKACELVRNEYIGKLHTVKVGLPSGTPDYSKRAALTETIPVPDGFDYETWLGPAPKAPYSPARTHVNWRWVLDYSGGQLTDWGGHHPDIAQWGMGTEDTGPIAVRNARATYADHPIYDTAVDYSFECEYKNGVSMIVSSKSRSGVTFEGTEGTVWVDRGRIESTPEGLVDAEIKENEIHLYDSRNHARNFIDCVYSREQAIAPIETAHRSITIAHLGNIAMKLNRDLKWNPKKEVFIGDDEANGKLSRPYRGPWNLM
ncbi:MAG: Gfo/Idh/MocA family oxidoreductase [Candidatus Hydrogenedentota bacterium]